MNSSAFEVLEARARAVSVDEDALTVDLADGRTIVLPLAWYPRLWHGTLEERRHLELFGDGAYIHWPDLAEDLTVAGLLAGPPPAGKSAIVKEVASLSPSRSRG